MRIRAGLIILLTILVVFGLYRNISSRDQHHVTRETFLDKQEVIEEQPTPTQSQKFQGPFDAAVFVPYWLLKDPTFTLPKTIDGNITTLIYFGISASETGINTDDPGYRNLQTFLTQTQNNNVERLLTLRMLNEDINTPYLKNPALAEKLIQETRTLAVVNGFDGIVLDLEHSVLPTLDVRDSITSFMTRFSKVIHDDNLTFAVTLFGDTYYRARPYDVPHIAHTVDTIYIMAYDFHKSYGEPGPNFPTYQTVTYAYSFEQMMSDFLADVPILKISLVLGMFGYDWSVDDQNRPTKAATPLTLNQAKARFYPTCPFPGCTITSDPDSMEIEVTYTDETGQKHSVWFENEVSVQIKTNLARQRGFSHVGFWAHGYY